MTRVFAYCRVSTQSQTCDNQIQEIRAAGYDILEHRVVTEQVSGSCAAFSRPQFKRLIDRLEPGDTLVVSKLDRIGRDSIDVQQTIEYCTTHKIRVVVLQLGNLDLTSSSGALIVKLLSAIASFERDLIIERVNCGLARARAQNVVLGRKPKTTPEQRQQIIERKAAGATTSALARDFKVSRATILSIAAAA
jgi:putative DNA-invertase from lambdoid prophage Rac